MIEIYIICLNFQLETLTSCLPFRKVAKSLLPLIQNRMIWTCHLIRIICKDLSLKTNPCLDEYPHRCLYLSPTIKTMILFIAMLRDIIKIKSKNSKNKAKSTINIMHPFISHFYKNKMTKSTMRTSKMNDAKKWPKLWLTVKSRWMQKTKMTIF